MNAIIMAAGMSSRFIPLSWECPKALLEVKGEILIERQIRQLKEAGVTDITVVTGYMADKFDYLSSKFGVTLVYNPDYARYNNTSTLMCVLDRLSDTWICSSDNYFTEQGYWEDVYLKNLGNLPLMRVRKFETGVINEFDSLAELQCFDISYISNSRSLIIKKICDSLQCLEKDIKNIQKVNVGIPAFSFEYQGDRYIYKKEDEV